MSVNCFCKGHEKYFECPVNYPEYPPNYPVPAIPLEVVIGVDEMYDAVYINRLNYGEDDPVIAALWDFNFDRCMDWDLPYGEYQCFSPETHITVG